MVDDYNNGLRRFVVPGLGFLILAATLSSPFIMSSLYERHEIRSDNSYLKGVR